MNRVTHTLRVMHYSKGACVYIITVTSNDGGTDRYAPARYSRLARELCTGRGTTTSDGLADPFGVVLVSTTMIQLEAALS